MLERAYEGDVADMKRPPLPPERESLLTGKPLPPRPSQVLPQDEYNFRDTLQVRMMNPTFVPPPTVTSVNPSVMSSTKNLYGGPDVSDMLKSIQTELDALKENVRTGSKAGDSCFYERIDDLHSRARPHTKTCRDYIVQNARDRGLIRIRTILDPQTSVAARLLWILLCAASLAFLSYQLYDRISLYLRFPSHTTIETRHLDKLNFPVITICNLNKFRLTNAVNLGVYTPLHQILHHTRPLNYSGIINQLDKSKLSYMDLLTSATHTRKDMIYGCDILNDSCRFKGRVCDPVDITDTFTDYGRCFTFKRVHADRSITKTGVLSGLSLVINVEQYDYLLGPKSAVGVHVSVRDNENQSVSDVNTINIPVGKYSTIDITKIKRQELQSTYNDCKTKSSSSAGTTQPEVSNDECLRECRRSFFVRRCNCIPIKDPKSHDTRRACRLSEYFACSLNSGRKIDFDETFCGCQKNCEITEYEMTTSQASISSYGAESSVRNFQGRYNLEKQYRSAMDKYHRFDVTIFEHDLRMLKMIPRELDETTKKEKFADYLVQFDKKQDKRITDAVNLLNKTLRSLNTTVSIDYAFFEQSTHIAFTVYGERIKNHLDIILKLEGDLEQRFNIDASDPDVQSILRRLKRIVQIDQTQSGSNVQEIESGIRSFRRRLFHGYGKNYIEFQKAKPFYMKVTQTLLNKSVNITVALKAQYTVLSGMTTGDSSQVLRRFFYNIRRLLNQEIPPLISLMGKIFDQYEVDRTDVRNFITTLPDQSNKLVANLKMWRSNLTSFRGAVTSLPVSLSSLRSEMTRLGQSYDNRTFGKVELAQKLQSQAISSPLRQAQEVLRDIGAMADELSEQGTIMADVMNKEGLTARLVHFGLAEKRVVDNLLHWIKFETLKKEVSHYVNVTTSKLQLILTYREELQEYVDTIKIDENFYRNNFLHLDVSYRDLTETVVSQNLSYSLFDLACDMGGAMALCIGASLLTLFDIAEFLERCIYYYMCKR